MTERENNNREKGRKRNKGIKERVCEIERDV